MHLFLYKIYDHDSLYQFLSRWARCDHCSELLTDLLPGKVTTVFERKEILNPKLNPGNSLIGVRIPDHHFVRQLVNRCGQPIALTSANMSDTRSTLDVEVRCTAFKFTYHVAGKYGGNKIWQS